MRGNFNYRGLALAAAAALLAALLVPLAMQRTPESGARAADLRLGMLSDPAAAGRLADMHGVVNFWASWCVACRVEHPLLLQLQRDGVPVFGVNHRDLREDALRWLDFYGDPYRYSLYDADGALGDALGIEALPVTLVVGSGGEILYTQLGPLDQGIIDSVIRPLLPRGASDLWSRPGGL
ncbi:MAG: redoxin family protein [Gammaproteobacteria bacterium]|nr:redoxin family protein [Gammaproteobacteria bacterium]MDH4253182.1 redoxin family protein [Gammaproteobacteria bacterium]MDH5308456.1 redoxin family protein [Gammaproteobacteria bacterium]